MNRTIWATMALLVCGPVFAQTPPAIRPVIETASELPRHSYDLAARPSEIVDDPAAVLVLAGQIDRNAAQTLATFEIRDVASRQRLLIQRMLVAALMGDYAAADRFSREASAIEPKPALRLTGDLETTGLIAAQSASSADARAAAYRAAVARALEPLPSAVIRSRIVEIRRSIDLTSPAYARGELITYADPIWREGQPMPDDIVSWIVGVAADERVSWPYRPAFRAALTDWLEANPAPAAADIWAAREVTFDENEPLTPVGVAIWDVGVDRSVYEGRNAVAPSLAFDTEFRRTEGDLKPTPDALRSQIPMYERYMRGRGILNLGQNGPDADFARQVIAGLDVNEIADFEAGFRFYTGWIHGTHVAGVAADGNPAIRIVPIRITFSDDAVPPPFDEALVSRMLAAAQTSIDYMKANNVRLANMSWGFTGENVEQSLAANNIEPDPARRTARAQAIFDSLFNGMTAMMADAPEILFVIAAGNSNEDLDFVRDMPGSINLPNVISVGAVDKTGALTSFASTGASVDLYALGYNVESFVPGGGRVVWSGASLSAPQVVNTAAKMLAVNPSLTTAQIVQILDRTASLSEEGNRLLNPAAAISAER